MEQTFHSEEGTLNLTYERIVSTKEPVTSCEEEVEQNIAELIKAELSFLVDNNFFTLADERIVSTNEPVTSCEEKWRETLLNLKWTYRSWLTISF